MNWRSKLRSRTRQPAFLWRLVIGITIIGIVLGSLAQAVFYDPADIPLREPRDPSGWRFLEQLAVEGQWADVWWNVPAEIYSSHEYLGPLSLAILAGICWLAFLLHSLRCYSLKDWRLWCVLAGIALGILSIWPTGFFSDHHKSRAMGGTRCVLTLFR